MLQSNRGNSYFLNCAPLPQYQNLSHATDGQMHFIFYHSSVRNMVGVTTKLHLTRLIHRAARGWHQEGENKQRCSLLVQNYVRILRRMLYLRQFLVVTAQMRRLLTCITLSTMRRNYGVF